MPITSFGSPSAISKPGVIANAAARPASPFDGQVVYQQDTDQAYVWNGSAWVLLSTGTAGDVGLVKVIPTGATNGTVAADGTVTIGSTVSSVTVSGAFSSLYDNYRIVYSNVTPSASQDLYFRLASGGTAATTNYTFGFSYVSTATGAVSGVGNALTSYHITGSVQSTSFRHLGSIDVFQPFLTQFTSIVSTGYITRADIVSSGVNGNHQTASSYDGFVLYPSTGTITGGTIRVYGYRN